MSINLGPSCKKCRKEGKKLFLKGERCYSVKCAMIKRPYAPGQHGQDKRRMNLSEFGTQLREKQKVKRIYGIRERQFRNYYERAIRIKGDTGNILANLLERRLDNIVYRLGFAVSRNQARQLVNHGHFLVNGKKVDIPSYLIKEGDVISIKNDKHEYFKNLKSTLKGYQPPSWLALNYQNFQGKAVSLPVVSEIDLGADIRLVIEYYSKF